MLAQWIESLPPWPLLQGQILLGVINGAFYALLSLGLSLVFGLLGIINFAHGAQFMLGAYVAWGLLKFFGLSFWFSLFLAPLIVGLFALALERFLLRRLYKSDPAYGLLLTFGIALVLEGVFRHYFGSSGEPYEIPEQLMGMVDLGFMFLPLYRAWALLLSLVVCVLTYLCIEKTKMGAYLRAAREKPELLESFGVRVSRLMNWAYAGCAALAALAGVLAAPILQVKAAMGSEIIIVVFAVVVVGGMGSILGSIVAGFLLGLIEGLTKAIYPQASSTVIFVVMALILLVRPRGLFGAEA